MRVKFQNQKLYSSNLLQLGTKEDIKLPVESAQNRYQSMLRTKRTPRTLKATTSLHSLYPDIQDELCSRHSTLFGKLKQTFTTLYDNMQPSSYVVVKGSCQFVQQQLTEIGLSMGLENGIVGLVSKTYAMSEMFVNCNHFTEEMIFSHQGQLQEGVHLWGEEMQRVIRLATGNLPEQLLQGGIFYLHANIPQGEFNYKQAFLIALYLSVMLINQNLPNFTIDQMIHQISQLKFVGTKQEIEKCFKGYRNRSFNLTLPGVKGGRVGLGEIELQGEENQLWATEQGVLEKQHKSNPIKHKPQTSTHHESRSHHSLSMTNQYKLIFCKLDLAIADVQYELTRRQQLLQRKRQLLKQMSHKYKINGLFELLSRLQSEIDVVVEGLRFESTYERVYRARSMQEIQALDEEEEILCHPNKFISKLLTQTHFLTQFSRHNIDLPQLVNHIWHINSKDLKIHSPDVVQLVQDMKAELEINGCMIINRNFLLIVVNRHNFTDLLCDIKEKMRKGELVSKSLLKIDDEDCLQRRWSSDKAIGEKIFSSVPSHGVGIFDPSEAIWYD